MKLEPSPSLGATPCIAAIPALYVLWREPRLRLLLLAGEPGGWR
jgi:hypothetical protein